MNKDIKIIHAEFRHSIETRYIHRLHGVLLVLLGLSTVNAGKLLGEPQRTVAHWVIQFKKQGLGGLREAKRSGRPEKLNTAQKKALFDVLAQSPKNVGIETDKWTNVLVSSLLAKRFGLKINVRQCSRLLRAFKDKRQI